MRLTVLVLAISAASIGNAAAQTTGTFTDVQADAGHSAYSKYCASCHGADLKGVGDFPTLTGEAFMSHWGERTTHDLYTKISNTMPFCGGGTLGDTDYTAIVAFLLKTYGAQDGDQPFTPETSVNIKALTGNAVTK